MIATTETFPNLNDESEGYYICALSKLDFQKARKLFDWGKRYKSMGRFGIECCKNGEVDLALKVSIDDQH